MRKDLRAIRLLCLWTLAVWMMPIQLFATVPGVAAVGGCGTSGSAIPTPDNWTHLLGGQCLEGNYLGVDGYVRLSVPALQPNTVRVQRPPWACDRQ